MSTPQKLKEIRRQFQEAIAYLKRITDKTSPEYQSPAVIARILRHKFGEIDASTIYRWISYKPNYSVQSHKAVLRIIEAVRYLKTHTESSYLQVRFAIIDHATEMLPILLVPMYPEWQAEHKAEVVNRPVANIQQALDALQKGDVDLAAVPSYNEYVDSRGERRQNNYESS